MRSQGAKVQYEQFHWCPPFSDINQEISTINGNAKHDHTPKPHPTPHHTTPHYPQPHPHPKKNLRKENNSNNKSFLYHGTFCSSLSFRSQGPINAIRSLWPHRSWVPWITKVTWFTSGTWTARLTLQSHWTWTAWATKMSTWSLLQL